jgi:CubicO group peptidase (beta-lactamase class C family)
MTTIPPIANTPSPSRDFPKGEVQMILNRHCAEYPKEVPVGCNLVVMREGKLPELLHAGEIPPDGPQNWGSTSKQFTAACIDTLVKQGKIKYDDDIRKLCPDLPPFKFNGVEQKVTVDDLLHMRSGLPEVWAIALMTGRDAEYLTNEELLGLLHQHPGMIFTPGAKEMYCNTNYYLLAKLVEDITKQPFVDYVREEILEPLGMQARCSADPTCPQTIPGYDGDPKSKIYMQEVTSPNLSYGTTGIIGPPSDMVKWNHAIAHQDYNLLEPPRRVSGTEKALYCRGLIVENVGEYRKIFHGGMLAGAVTIYRRYEHQDPSKTFAFFLATNADNVSKAEEIADDVADSLAGIKMERPRTEPESLARNQRKDAEVFSGTYRCVEFDTEWIVEPKEKERDKWAVSMRPADSKKFPPIDFDPQFDNEQHLVFQSGYGGGILERTQEGFIYTTGNMAAVHFVRTEKI